MLQVSRSWRSQFYITLYPNFDSSSGHNFSSDMLQYLFEGSPTFVAEVFDHGGPYPDDSGSGSNRVAGPLC